MRYFVISARREVDLAALDHIPKVILDREGSELVVAEADAPLVRRAAQEHDIAIEGDEAQAL